jgi:hypothetical protein
VAPSRNDKNDVINEQLETIKELDRRSKRIKKVRNQVTQIECSKKIQNRKLSLEAKSLKSRRKDFKVK